jgi:hypothetical protein
MTKTKRIFAGLALLVGAWVIIFPFRDPSPASFLDNDLLNGVTLIFLGWLVLSTIVKFAVLFGRRVRVLTFVSIFLWVVMVILMVVVFLTQPANPGSHVSFGRLLVTGLWFFGWPAFDVWNYTPAEIF